MVNLHPHQGLSPETLQVLEERARALATTETSAEDALAGQVQGQTFLVFRYLEERYGLPVSLVNEVVPLSKVVTVPGVPSHVVGLTRLRGKILALVNLRGFLRQTMSGFADADLAVVTEFDDRLFGIVCSKVESLITVRSHEIEIVPDSFNERIQRTMAGFAQRDIMLLDPKSLLAEDGFVIQ